MEGNNLAVCDGGRCCGELTARGSTLSSTPAGWSSLSDSAPEADEDPRSWRGSGGGSFPAPSSNCPAASAHLGPAAPPAPSCVNDSSGPGNPGGRPCPSSRQSTPSGCGRLCPCPVAIGVAPASCPCPSAGTPSCPCLCCASSRSTCMEGAALPQPLICPLPDALPPAPCCSCCACCCNSCTDPTDRCRSSPGSNDTCGVAAAGAVAGADARCECGAVKPNCGIHTSTLWIVRGLCLQILGKGVQGVKQPGNVAIHFKYRQVTEVMPASWPGSCME